MATLTAPTSFSPVEDAENIKKACQGWGTDEEAIISILGHRNLFQRKLIRQAYMEIYQEELIQQLKSELSGHFERAICLWVLDPPERDAVLANTALQKHDVDHKVLIEIACNRSPEDLLAVRRSYRSRFQRSLEEDVAAHTSGDIRKLLVATMSAYRYDGDEFDEKLAHSEATMVHEEIQDRVCNHEETIRVLSTRSEVQLRVVFNQYKDIYGRSITKDLVGQTASEYLSLLRTAIRCIHNPEKYYAKVLRSSISGTGEVDKEALSRVVVTRAEKDLTKIGELFLKRNDTTLGDAVAKQTSGDYKSFLLALLGNQHN